MIETQVEKHYSREQVERILDKSQPIVVEKEPQPFRSAYTDFFAEIDSKFNQKEELVKRLFMRKIKYLQERDHGVYRIQAIHSTFDKEIVTLQVELGPFTLYHTLYNNLSKNYTHFLHGKASTFATIYEYSNLQQQSVIKCTTFKPKDFLDTLVMIIKEYSFLKIAAALGIGPQLTEIMGFDLVAHPDCIQFSMQRCLPLQKVDSKIVRILKEKLMRLHLLQIIHVDIKPANFCFSSYLNEPIFIDFGLSEVIAERPGQLTHTFFMGSLNCCSPQMTKLYYESTSGYIDLYYNDTVCMTRSFANIDKESSQNSLNLSNKSHISIEKSQEEEGIDAFPSAARIGKIANKFALMRIKFFIYSARPIQMWYKFDQQILVKHKDYFLSFISSLSYTTYLENLSTMLLSYNKIDRFLTFDFVCNLRNNTGLSVQKGQADDEEGKCDTLMVTKRMNQLKNGVQIQIFNISKKQLQLDLNFKNFLSSPHLLSKLQKSLYFLNFAKITDLRNDHFKKKSYKIVSNMLDYLKIQNLKEEQMKVKLGSCWNQILNHFIQTETRYGQQAIPILFNNLMIVEFYSLDDLIQIFQRIGSIDRLSPLQRCELIYMSSMALTWVKYCMKSRYNYVQFQQRFSQAVACELQKIKDYVPQTLITIVNYLIFCQLLNDHLPDIIYQLKYMIQQVQEILSNQVYFNIKLMIWSKTLQFYLSHNTRQQQSESMFYEFLNMQNHLKYRCLFNHYHFYIMSYAKQTKKFHIARKMEVNFIKCINLLAAFHSRFNKRKDNIDHFIYLFQNIDPLKLKNSYNVVKKMFNRFQSGFYHPKKDLKLSQMIKNKTTLDFFISIEFSEDIDDQGLIHSFEIIKMLLHIFITVNKENINIKEQLQKIIQHVCKLYHQTKNRDSTGSNFFIMVQILALIEITVFKNLQAGFDLYFNMFVNLNNCPENKSFSNYCLMDKMFQIIKFCKPGIAEKKTQSIYSVWMTICNQVHLFKVEPNQRYILTFNKLILCKRKNHHQFLTFQEINVKNLQLQFNQIYANKYLIESYVFVTMYPEKCYQLLKTVKSMSKIITKNCEKYSASCALLFLLLLDTQSDQESSRILRHCINHLSHFKGQSKILLLNALYRHLLANYFPDQEQIEIRDIFVNSPKFLMERLKGVATRKIKFWCRSLIKNSHQLSNKMFPIKILTKNCRDINQNKRFSQIVQKWVLNAS